MKDISLYEKMNILKNNYPIKLLSVDKAPYLMPHWHEHFEFIYFKAGKAVAFCDGKRMEVEAGDLVVANSTEVHSFVATSPVDHYALIVSLDILKDIEYKNTVIQNKIPHDEFVMECLEDIAREFSESHHGSDLYIKGRVYSLFAHLVFNYSVKESVSNEERPQQLERLDRVFHYISGHYTDDVSAKTLADLLFVTESYFCRFFKKATGITLSHYMIEFRIKKSQLLLENTDLSIAEVAENVGIDDANYFSRIFKKTTGLSPKEYRKNAKK